MIISIHSHLLLQHEQWQRMSKQPGAEVINAYILYNQTVDYKGSTIIISDANGIVAE